MSFISCALLRVRCKILRDDFTGVTFHYTEQAAMVVPSFPAPSVRKKPAQDLRRFSFLLRRWMTRYTTNGHDARNAKTPTRRACALVDGAGKAASGDDAAMLLPRKSVRRGFRVDHHADFVHSSYFIARYHIADKMFSSMAAAEPPSSPQVVILPPMR